MQTEGRDLDSLHEQASLHYLEGEFARARELWQELLRHAPDDERALAGVRLCDLVVEEEPGAVAADPGGPPTSSSAPDPPSEAPANPLQPFDVDENAGFDLSMLDLQGGPPAAKPELPARQVGSSPAEINAEPTPAVGTESATVPDVPELPDPNRQGEGIDFGNITLAETIALASNTPESAPPRDPSVHEASIDPSATAAAELQKRIGELLEEAEQAHRGGDTAEALSLLSRIFILDEENEAAREMHQQLMSSLALDPVGSAEETTGTPDRASSEDLLAGLDLDAESAVPDLDLAGLDDETAPGEEPAPPWPTDEAEATEPPPPTAVAEPPTEEAPPPAEPQEAAPPPRESTRTPAEIPRPASPGAGRIRKLAIPGAAVVLLTGAGLFYGFGMRGGHAEPPPIQTTQPPVGKEKALEPQAAAEPGGEPQAPQEDLETVLARARAAFDAEDYADAILAFNKVIQIDPNHQEAQERIIVAGELYREQKAVLERRERAIRNFQQQDYRGALVLFYRLPETEDADQLARYKENAWFNMGLQSLQAGDCRTAREHLTEAQAIDAADPRTQAVIDLVQRCIDGAKQPADYRKISQLTPRGLED